MLFYVWTSGVWMWNVSVITHLIVVVPRRITNTRRGTSVRPVESGVAVGRFRGRPVVAGPVNNTHRRTD